MGRVRAMPRLPPSGGLDPGGLDSGVVTDGYVNYRKHERMGWSADVLAHGAGHYVTKRNTVSH